MTPSPFRAAWSDIREGMGMFDLWWTVSYNQIRHRYRRSIIGPFWLTLNMLVLAVTLGLLYGALFKQDLRTHMPFVVVGFLCWSFLSLSVADACNTFIASANVIKNTNIPLSVFMFQDVGRNVLVFAHNATVLVVLYAVWPENLSWGILEFVPAFALILLNTAWIGLLLGMACARYRDIPQAVTSILQMVVFLTPVFWPPEALGERRFVLDFNPFYHALTILRDPLLGRTPPVQSWAVMLALAVGGWLVTLVLFARYRRRIAFAL